jgi:hypothetical protein
MKAQLNYTTRLPQTRRLSVTEILAIADTGIAYTKPAQQRLEMRETLRNNIEAEKHWLTKATTQGAREKCTNIIARLKAALTKIPSNTNTLTMKNKTKITCVADHSHAQPFKTVVACQKCQAEKSVTVYPALGKNFFECQTCLFINIVEANELELAL